MQIFVLDIDVQRHCRQVIREVESSHFKHRCVVVEDYTLRHPQQAIGRSIASAVARGEIDLVVLPFIDGEVACGHFTLFIVDCRSSLPNNTHPLYKFDGLSPSPNDRHIPGVVTGMSELCGFEVNVQCVTVPRQTHHNCGPSLLIFLRAALSALQSDPLVFLNKPQQPLTTIDLGAVSKAEREGMLEKLEAEALRWAASRTSAAAVTEV